MGAGLFSSQACSRQVVAVSLAAQRIYNDICLTRLIVHFKLIVFDQLEPPSLPRVQIWLCKDVLQALVVHIDVNNIPK
jgi:hypothetical protein